MISPNLPDQLLAIARHCASYESRIRHRREWRSKYHALSPKGGHESFHWISINFWIWSKFLDGYIWNPSPLLRTESQSMLHLHQLHKCIEYNSQLHLGNCAIEVHVIATSGSNSQWYWRWESRGLSHLLDLLRRIVFVTSHAWHWVSCLEILPLVCNDYYLIGMSLTIRAWRNSLGDWWTMTLSRCCLSNTHTVWDAPLRSDGKRLHPTFQIPVAPWRLWI